MWHDLGRAPEPSGRGPGTPTVPLFTMSMSPLVRHPKAASGTVERNSIVRISVTLFSLPGVVGFGRPVKLIGSVPNCTR